jgi:phospholipid/cholesterol/gamma-HCH transport system ATP-binding protein
MSQALISVRNLVAKYAERTILNDISVDIMPGEGYSNPGGAACGITTLLKNILRLQEPFSGSVKFWERKCCRWTNPVFSGILKRVGMLFQNGALLNSISVYENISIPLELHTKLPEEIRDRIIRVKLSLSAWLKLSTNTPANSAGA